MFLIGVPHLLSSFHADECSMKSHRWNEELEKWASAGESKHLCTCLVLPRLVVR